MDQTEEQNRKTAFDRDLVRSQVGAPLAPQVARAPKNQEKPGPEQGQQAESEAGRTDSRVRQQETAEQAREKSATAAEGVAGAAEKIPGAGAAVSGLAKNFPILWLIIGWAKKIEAKSVFLQISIKVLLICIGPFLWPLLVLFSYFSMGLLPKTTIWEQFAVLFLLIIVPLILAGIALLFICNFPGLSLCPSV